MTYYAVRTGRVTGVYTNWSDCQKQVIKFKGAEFKKFENEEEALAFVDGQAMSDGVTVKDVNDLSDKEAVAYVDGSYSDSKGSFSYGVVVIQPGYEELHLNGRGDNSDLLPMRNVAGELTGAVKAMMVAIDRGVERLYLHYDYAGIEKWASNDWQAKEIGSRWYKEFVQSINGQLEVKFIKVKAHSGVHYNEVADKLAGMA